MIAFWIFMFLSVALLGQVQADIHAHLVQKHSFHLYALRDELREAAIDGRARSSNWVFEYLDSSIAKTIAALPTLTVWALLYFTVAYHGDARIRSAVQHLDRALEKPENACLAVVHEKYVEAIGDFLVGRHVSVRAILWLIPWLFASIRIAQRLQRSWQRALQLSTEVPETSTLSESSNAARAT
jgi:hypothetical protein